MRRDTGRRSCAFLLFVTLTLLLTSACSRNLTDAGDVVRLGVIVPLTSGIPAAARAVVDGADLAVSEINAAGGVQGRRIALVTLDDRGTAEEAARLVEQLAGMEVLGIVGPVTDATAAAAAPVAERFRLVMISPGATATLPYGGHFVFRTALPARAQARAMAGYLVGNRGFRRIAVVHDSNDYGTMVATGFEEAARGRGATITSRRLYRDGDTDFSRHVAGLVAERAQALFIAGYPDEGALLLRQLRAAAPGVMVAGSEALFSQDTPAWAGEAAEGLHVPAGFVPDARLPVVRSFVTRFREKHGRTPNQFAAQAYDAVQVLAFALRRAGSDRNRVREAIASLKRFPGVTGSLSFDQWGDPVRSVVISRVKQGTFVTAD